MHGKVAVCVCVCDAEPEHFNMNIGLCRALDHGVHTSVQKVVWFSCHHGTEMGPQNIAIASSMLHSSGMGNMRKVRAAGVSEDTAVPLSTL